MCIHLKFDYKKTTQSLNFFALKQGGRINKMKALKLVFFADRYHLRKYGRPITNDEYFAMKCGPVASGAKDIAEMSDYIFDEIKDYASAYIKFLPPYQFESKKSVEEKVFSESDIEALSFAWEKFGNISNEFDIKDITHEYPEWKKHEQSLKSCPRLKMKLEDFFDDPDNEQMEKCFPLTVEGKRDSIEHLKEIATLEAMWS